MGKASFYGRDFIVYPDVFIPRFDSEVIIDVIKKKTFQTAIDIGCGTGCIGISIANERKCQGVLCDIDIKAVSHARNEKKRLTPKLKLDE